MNPWAIVGVFASVAFGLMQAVLLADVKDIRDRLMSLEETCRNRRNNG